MTAIIVLWSRPDMLAPAMIPVQLVNMTANTVAKDITVLVL